MVGLWSLMYQSHKFGCMSSLAVTVVYWYWDFTHLPIVTKTQMDSEQGSLFQEMESNEEKRVGSGIVFGVQKWGMGV